MHRVFVNKEAAIVVSMHQVVINKEAVQSLQCLCIIWSWRRRQFLKIQCLNMYHVIVKKENDK